MAVSPFLPMMNNIQPFADVRVVAGQVEEIGRRPNDQIVEPFLRHDFPGVVDAGGVRCEILRRWPSRSFLT